MLIFCHSVSVHEACAHVCVCVCVCVVAAHGLAAELSCASSPTGRSSSVLSADLQADMSARVPYLSRKQPRIAVSTTAPSVLLVQNRTKQNTACS